MEEAKETSGRKVYFIEKSFKTRFIVRFFIIVVLSQLLTIGIVYFVSEQSKMIFFGNARLFAKDTTEYMLPILIKAGIIAMIFAGLATLLFTLFFSHKTAGPLFRFKEVMDTLGEGDYLSDFKVREFDALEDFAKGFDEMIAKMRLKINELKDSSNGLREKLNNIPQGELPDKLKVYLEELKNTSEALDKKLSDLKS